MKMMNLSILILLIWGSLFVACHLPQSGQSSVSSPSLVHFLPDDSAVSGWHREGTPFCARGLAELAQQINGGAPFYIDRGVKESVFQDYTNPDKSLWITIIVHRTASPKEAKELYNDVYAEDPIVLPALGEGGRSSPNLIGAYLVEFHKGSHYAKLTITDKAKASQDALLSLSEKIAQALPN